MLAALLKSCLAQVESRMLEAGLASQVVTAASTIEAEIPVTIPSLGYSQLLPFERVVLDRWKQLAVAVLGLLGSAG